MIVSAKKPLGAYSSLTRERQVDIEVMIKELIEDYALVEYPQSITRTAKVLGVDLRPYSSLNQSCQALARSASEDAFSVTTADMSIAAIVFEDSEGSMHGRARFSGAHELAHIVLGHSEDDPLREPEADYFAGYFLAPHPLVMRMPEGITVAERFGVSAWCADFAIDQATDRRREGEPWLPHEEWLIENIVWRGGGLLGRA